MKFHTTSVIVMMLTGIEGSGVGIFPGVGVLGSLLCVDVFFAKF